MARTAAPRQTDPEVGGGPGYDEDFVLWTRHQAAQLRARRPDLIDWANLAEEIESLGKRDRRQLANRLEVLLMHLAKWQFQPAGRSGSWRGTIRTQRGRLLRLIDDSPHLRQHVAADAAEVWPRARAIASDETGVDLDRFPEGCPYSDAELLSDDFWPETNETS